MVYFPFNGLMSTHIVTEEKFQIEASDILYQDEYLGILNKPHGLAMHKSRLVRNAQQFAVHELKNYFEQKIHLVHRLDRKTSGILLFAFDADVQSQLNAQFRNREVKKEYLALVRGFVEPEFEIDYSLVSDKGKEQEAQTSVRRLEEFEIPIPSDQFETSRYSLVLLQPHQGRYHQLRKHMAHIRHPIVGDRPHGCSKQNKIWRDCFNMTRMLLHASKLSFVHPISNDRVQIEAPRSAIFNRSIDTLKKMNLINGQI